MIDFLSDKLSPIGRSPENIVIRDDKWISDKLISKKE